MVFKECSVNKTVDKTPLYLLQLNLAKRPRPSCVDAHSVDFFFVLIFAPTGREGTGIVEAYREGHGCG